MRGTGLVIDRRFAEHDPGPGHPERPERIHVLADLFEQPELAGLARIAPRPATEAELRRVHDPEHIRAVAASAGRPQTRYDADTAASARSFEVACLAAGAAIELADAVFTGALANGFAALRPPGHHAERDRAMGFCLFNNVAIVARHLQVAHKCERILVLDWDVHHGNGTQHTFWTDASVLYVSLHQFPFYPGTGSVEEIGAGAGTGYTVNLPMRAGWGPAEYAAAFREVIVPIAERFDPQFVLVSAGFDAHRADPLAMMQLDRGAFAWMTDVMVHLADRCASGKLVLLLEGGYSLEALKDSVAAVIGRLREPQPPAEVDAELPDWGAAARSILAPHWEI